MFNQKNEKKLRKALEAIIQDDPYSLKAFVAREALEYDGINKFVQDSLHHASAFGSIGSKLYFMTIEQVLNLILS